MKGSAYFEMQRLSNDLALSMAKDLDYAAGWTLATLENTPTTYKGKGRPCKTDYGLWKHPFDGRTIRSINYPSA